MAAPAECRAPSPLDSVRLARGIRPAGPLSTMPSGLMTNAPSRPAISLTASRTRGSWRSRSRPAVALDRDRSRRAGNAARLSACRRRRTSCRLACLRGPRGRSRPPGRSPSLAFPGDAGFKLPQIAGGQPAEMLVELDIAHGVDRIDFEAAIDDDQPCAGESTSRATPVSSACVRRSMTGESAMFRMIVASPASAGRPVLRRCRRR